MTDEFDAEFEYYDPDDPQIEDEVAEMGDQVLMHEDRLEWLDHERQETNHILKAIVRRFEKRLRRADRRMEWMAKRLEELENRG